MCELACVPSSARICFLGRLKGIFLLSFYFASATVGRICYLGTLNSICLFSFHSASATVGRLCYLGTPSGICLFSFHLASATIDRITPSRHARPQLPLWQLKVARNEVENASFVQRSAHHDSRIWRPELIEPAAERKRHARGRRPTFKSAYPDPRIFPQCNISSNYPL